LAYNASGPIRAIAGSTLAAHVVQQLNTTITGIVDYASSMAFERITNATVSNTTYPTNDQISVRFLFSNGTAAANPLTAYPLFG
jgi:hypothetical protein